MFKIWDCHRGIAEDLVLLAQVCSDFDAVWSTLATVWMRAIWNAAHGIKIELTCLKLGV